MRNQDTVANMRTELSDNTSKKPEFDATRYSFFQAMRDLEIAHSEYPRLGHAYSLSREPVRITQSPELGFAPTTISRMDTRESGITELEQRFVGLLGPGGPFPLHLSELVRNRSRHADDQALQSFLDIFHHRIGMLFYRAWSSSRAVVQNDRPNDDRWHAYLASLIGIGFRSTINRDNWSDQSKAFFSGHLSGMRRTREGLESIVSNLLDAKAQVQPFALRWLPLPKNERTTLGRNNQLGRSTIIGERVPDRQGSIDINVGPVARRKFQDLLPGSEVRHVLRDAVRNHSGSAIDAKVTVAVLRGGEDSVTLGKIGMLGRTAWIGSVQPTQTRDDYSFDLNSLDNPNVFSGKEEARGKSAA